jgi:hypothetical protein
VTCRGCDKLQSSSAIDSGLSCRGGDSSAGCGAAFGLHALTRSTSSSSRKVSGLTPTAVFALATPKNPIDRGAIVNCARHLWQKPLQLLKQFGSSESAVHCRTVPSSSLSPAESYLGMVAAADVAAGPSFW